MKLELLAQYLQTQGLGTQGTDIFVHHMDFETRGILLRLPLEGVKIDWNIPGYYSNVPIQAIVRDKQQVSGDTRAKQVSDKLTLYKHDFGSGLYVQQMLPIALPIVYPRTPGEDLEWSINFHATYSWTG